MHQARKSLLVVLLVPGVADCQPCLSYPKAKEPFGPGLCTQSLAHGEHSVPLLSFSSSSSPSGFALIKQAVLESEQ